MSLLFAHDFRATRYKGEVYDRSYSYRIWNERYISAFGKMTICNRIAETDKDITGKLEKSSGPNVNFRNDIPFFKGPDVFVSSKIKGIISEELDKNEVVIVRLDSFLGLLTIDICKKRNKPYLIEVAGCAWDSFWNHGISGKILAPYIFLKTKKAIKEAPFVVYVTKEFLQRRYPTNGKNTNISNVELKAIDETVLEKKIEAVQRKNVSEKIVLGTAANVDVRYKGHQYVIDALNIMKSQGHGEFEYQVAGQGDQTFLKNYAAQKGVSDQVVFLGSMTHDAIYDWLDNSVDIYVQPSLQEGLPRSVIEAMSRGCACVGTDVAGIPELIDSEYTYARKGNMGDSIAKILVGFNKEKRIQQGKVNFEKSKDYTSEVLAARRKEFFYEYLDYLNNKR